MSKKLIIFFSVITITLLIGEWIVRMIGYTPNNYENNSITRRYIEMNHKRYFYPDSILGWRLAPGHYYLPLEDNKFSEANHDSMGYRITSSHPRSSPVSDSTRKIFVFGCSFTYGVYMVDSESLAYRIQDSLPDTRVYDMAIPAYGDVQSLISLRNSIKAGLIPDVVILDYSDIHDERNFFNLEWQKKISHEQLSFHDVSIPKGRIVQDTLQIRYETLHYHSLPLAKNSALINLMDDVINKIKGDPKQATEVSYQTILSMARLCADIRSRFILAGIDTDAHTLTMLHRCNAVGIETIALGDGCQTCSNPPNGKTHRIYAQKFLTLLRK